jgi:hypothetical protein
LFKATNASCRNTNASRKGTAVIRPEWTGHQWLGRVGRNFLQARQGVSAVLGPSTQSQCRHLPPNPHDCSPLGTKRAIRTTGPPRRHSRPVRIETAPSKCLRSAKNRRRLAIHCPNVPSYCMVEPFGTPAHVPKFNSLKIQMPIHPHHGIKAFSECRMMVAPRASLVGRRNYPGVPMARRQQAKPADPL